MRDEQRRALAYLQRKGADAPLSEVRSAVTRALTSLESLLDGLDEGQVGRAPAGGGWSPLEVVDHLVESHRPASEQLRAARRGDDPGPAIPAHIQSADVAGLQWSDLVAELKSIHREILHSLEGDDRDGSRIPIVMVLKASHEDGSVETLEWIEPLHWKSYAIGLKVHSQEHLAQIQRGL